MPNETPGVNMLQLPGQNHLQLYKCLGYFEHFLEVAEYSKDSKVIEWAIFEREDALALDGDQLPKMPEKG